MSTKSWDSKVMDGQVTAIRKWLDQNGLAIATVVGILALWWGYSEFLNTRGNAYFPSPAYTVSQTIEFQDIVITGLRVTITEILIGFTFAMIMGLIAGLVFAESYVLRQSTLPALIYAYALPHAIMAPIFLIWFGSGTFAVGLFVAWFAFFSVFVNTMSGLNQVSEEFHQLADVAGATEWQKLRYIKFWAAMPHITSGIKIGVQQSIIGAIIAEFIATGGGLGNLIIVAGATSRLGLMFGVLILIMVFAVVLYQTVNKGLDYVTPGPS